MLHSKIIKQMKLFKDKINKNQRKHIFSVLIEILACYKLFLNALKLTCIFEIGMAIFCWLKSMPDPFVDWNEGDSVCVSTKTGSDVYQRDIWQKNDQVGFLSTYKRLREFQIFPTESSKRHARISINKIIHASNFISNIL